MKIWLQHQKTQETENTGKQHGYVTSENGGGGFDHVSSKELQSSNINTSDAKTAVFTTTKVESIKQGGFDQQQAWLQQQKRRNFPE